AVAHLPPDLVLQVVGDRDLQEVSGNALVAEDRPRILDRGPDIEIAAGRTVRRYEIEPLRIAIVEPRRIHETTRRRRLEGFGKLANREWPEIGRQRHQPPLLEKIDHLFLARLVRSEKGLLIGGNV